MWFSVCIEYLAGADGESMMLTRDCAYQFVYGSHCGVRHGWMEENWMFVSEWLRRMNVYYWPIDVDVWKQDV